MARHRTTLFVAAVGLVLLSVTVYAVTVLMQNESRGMWATQALAGSACLMVLAAHCLFWRWRVSRGPRLTGAGIAGWVALLSALSVVAVTLLFAIAAATVYQAPWSTIP